MTTSKTHPKFRYTLFAGVLAVFLFACSGLKPTKNMNNDLMEIDKIEKLVEHITIKPHASVDWTELRRQYKLNPARWAKAFDFLMKTDLKAIAKGRYELEGSNLFVNVDEYVTKDEENTKYESHKRYADIQYIVSGEEKIGISTLDKMKDHTAYEEVRDIAFYTSDSDTYHLADPKHFFIFFPGDPHRPCVKVNANIPVKKIVLKVGLQ